MSWLEQHIQEFVKPQIGDFDQTPLGYFTQEELTVLKNSWRSIKRQANGQTVLLPGRDVFLFEVLARRENYPTIFMPECSRMTVRHIAKELPELKDYFLFDTGFAGSIPRNLGTNKFKLFSAIENSKQVFPRLSFSRGFALKVEGTPKYWLSGRMAGLPFERLANRPDKVDQPFSSEKEFEDAARLTIEVYKNSSPKFINKHQPIASLRRW